jgi:SSS family solute:Na+ symporter
MLMKLGPLDFGVIIAYFVTVLGVGYWLKDKMKTSSDFLLSGRSF